MSMTEKLFTERTPKSKMLYEKAKTLFPSGVCHGVRFYPPYPLYANKAKGSKVWDVDGNEYIDYWMGHLSLILGHSPAPVIEALQKQIRIGTHWGIVNEPQIELAELVQKMVPCAEKIRFCNTGTEATMYAIRLARAYTGKNVMLKAKGGWHGYNTELLWGTSTTGDYNIPDSAGMPPTINHYVKFFDFNDIDGTLRKIRKEPDLAGLIVEPVMGSAGIIPAQKEFLKVLKEEAESRNFVLIFDEIITGFRLGPSGGQGYYGITPHLATMGKVMGGGLSIGAVVGQDEIMRLTDQNRIPNKSQKVAIGGGTFSCNPMSMVAGVATLKVLKQDAGIYERIRNLSAKLRSGIEKAFTEQDIPVQFTGLESLFQVNFLKTKDAFIKSASDSANSDLRSKNLFNLKLLTRGVYTLHAHGAVSSAHSEADISKSIQVTREIAKEMREGRR